MRRRDARGRWRRATDEERWPDPVERERIVRIRSYFDFSKDSFLALQKATQFDISLITRQVW